eukprot:6929127-Heterocapsa_arctica.AAC.1
MSAALMSPASPAGGCAAPALPDRLRNESLRCKLLFPWSCTWELQRARRPEGALAWQPRAVDRSLIEFPMGKCLLAPCSLVLLSDIRIHAAFKVGPLKPALQ